MKHNCTTIPCSICGWGMPKNNFMISSRIENKTEELFKEIERELGYEISSFKIERMGNGINISVVPKNYVEFINIEI